MGKINTRDFVGSRGRFQRMRDAKVFNGWIESFFGSKLDVSTHSDNSLVHGDIVRFEGFGHHISVVFTAKIESISCSETTTGTALIEGSEIKLQTPSRTVLQLLINSPVRYAASPEAVRIQANELPTRVQFGDQQVSGVTVDAAPNGAGVILSQPIEPGTNLVCTIQTPFGTVRGQGVARYCRIDRERDESYRVGVMFTDMGRIERPRWDRFLSELPAA